MAATFPTSLGGNGNTYSNNDFLNNGHETNFIVVCEQIVKMAESAASNAISVDADRASVAADKATVLSYKISVEQTAAGLSGIAIGRDLLSAARNADLGACAFMSLEQLPLCIYPVTLSGAYALVASDFGKAILSNAHNITLPDAARCSTPWAVVIKNIHASTSITVTRAGTDTIDGGTSITIAAGVSKKIIKSALGAFVSL